MKAIEYSLSCGAVYYAVLNYIVQSDTSVDKTLVCGHSDESYWTDFTFGTIYYAVQRD